MELPRRGYLGLEVGRCGGFCRFSYGHQVDLLDTLHHMLEPFVWFPRNSDIIPLVEPLTVSYMKVVLEAAGVHRLKGPLFIHIGRWAAGIRTRSPEESANEKPGG